jgi:hypothetical protein
MLLMATFGLLPLLLAAASWWLHRSEARTPYIAWRNTLVLIGLACVSVSAFILTAFTVHAYVISRGTTPYDLDRAYPVLWMMAFALIASILAFFGRRLSRLFMIATGLVTFYLWYVAALAASP